MKKNIGEYQAEKIKKSNSLRRLMNNWLPRYCLREKNLKELQIHKDTTNINRSDESTKRFSVSDGDTAPALKIKESILDNISKAKNLR